MAESTHPDDRTDVIVHELLILVGVLTMLNIGLSELLFRIAVRKLKRVFGRG